MKLFQLILFLFLFVACNHSGSSNNQTAKTPADSIMDEIMKDHDIGMAKMNKIDEAQKKVQQAIDSISKLSFKVQKSSAQYSRQLDSVYNRLTFAERDMETWMNEFNMDSLKNNEKERVKYLQSEKLKITKVKNAMIGSLQKADSLLKKK